MVKDHGQTATCQLQRSKWFGWSIKNLFFIIVIWNSNGGGSHVIHVDKVFDPQGTIPWKALCRTGVWSIPCAPLTEEGRMFHLSGKEYKNTKGNPFGLWVKARLSSSVCISPPSVSKKNTSSYLSPLYIIGLSYQLSVLLIFSRIYLVWFLIMFYFINHRED
jgi:hypothetical protein